MKKLFYLFINILVLSFLLFFENCGSDNPAPQGSWTAEEKQSHDQVINLQDEIGTNLDDWFQSMDSLDAIQQAYEAFLNSENVSSATINSQGIAVQYSNGMRGGLFLNAKDDKSEVGEFVKLDNIPGVTDEGLKSLVNKKKMILIDPHYFQRSYYTDQIRTITGNNMSKAGIDLSTFYKNEEATVDRFTELSGYGVIQIYSHGWAWPKQENITDVYLLTGETANETTSSKYWDELKAGNIPVMKVDESNKYWVSERFIAEHNDFSKDTVLFYGGFCYSFLSDWPDIIDGFADGAYMGFDWSVYTSWNANWAVNSMFYLTDTTADQPVTLQEWMLTSEVDKSYWNIEDQRTVHILYTGDGNLKLWDDISVRLIALSSDGAPVSVPGEAGTAYPFRCVVNSSNNDFQFVWDIGDGSSPATSSNEVNITWSESGQYILKVDVIDKLNNTEYGAASLEVNIEDSGNTEVKDFILTCNNAGCVFGPERAVQFSPPANLGGDENIGWSSNIEWSGSSFSGTTLIDNGGKYTISGSLIEDAQTINFVANLEYVSEITGEIFLKYTITVNNCPFSYYNPDSYPYPSAGYAAFEADIQNYVTGFDGYYVDNDGTHNVTGIDWSVIDKLHLDFYKE